MNKYFFLQLIIVVNIFIAACSGNINKDIEVNTKGKIRVWISPEYSINDSLGKEKRYFYIQGISKEK